MPQEEPTSIFLTIVFHTVPLVFSEYTGNSPPALLETRYSPIFDLGFEDEGLGEEADASDAIVGSGVRRRA